MSSLRQSWIVLLVAVALAAVAGIASAAEGDPVEEASEDTLLNFGYDEENHVLIVNTSATDSPYDCMLENGTLKTHYDDPVDGGPIAVDELEEFEVESGEFKPVEFLNRPQEDVDTEEFTTLATGPATYTGADGECGLSGGLVGGSKGQINHGQFMKAFHQLVDKQGMGCLNRVMAHSDLGKGDQQVRTSEVSAVELGESGMVDFTTAAVDCKRDKHEKGEDHPGQGNDKSAKSDSRDKSDKAQGSDE